MDRKKLINSDIQTAKNNRKTSKKVQKYLNIEPISRLRLRFGNDV